MKQTLFKVAILFSMAFPLFSTLHAQTKIGGAPGAASPDALLQLGDSLTTKGLLLPRVALSASDLPAPLGAHKAGMIVYNTAIAGSHPNDVTPGIYYNDGTQWMRLKIDGGASAMQDTLTGDSFITITGGNGAVLQQVNISLNMNPVSDSLSRSSRFVDSLVTNTTFRDSIRSLTQIMADTLNGDNFITITGGNGAVLQQANASLNMNPVSDSLSRSLRFVDSLVTNTTFRDSIQSLTQITADTLSGDNFITVTGGNGAVLQQANTTLNIPAVADTLNKLNLFWGVNGNAGTTPATNFIGTTDNTGVSIKANNTQGIYIAPSGSVGIGAGTAPTAVLDVNGDARVRTMASGAATDSFVTVDNSGSLRKRTAADVNSFNWNIVGNTGTDTALNFIGTKDNKALMMRVNDTMSGILSKVNTAFGFRSINPATKSYGNVALGTNLMSSVTTGYQNVAIGSNTMGKVNTGCLNIAVGYSALPAATYSLSTIAIGNYAFVSYVGGYTGNIGLGNYTLNKLTGAGGNVAIGERAQQNNLSGSNNVAVGMDALNQNIGRANTAIGTSVLMAINASSAEYNVGLGYQSLTTNTTGYNNTGVGSANLKYSTTGYSNTALGTGAFANSTTGRYNTAIGHFAGAISQTGNYNIVIGSITTGTKVVDASYPAASGLALSSAAASYEMNIGNTLFGTNIDSVVGVGRIGINTNAPQATLHVKGTARVDTLLSGAATDSLVTADGNGNLRRRKVTDVVGSIGWLVTGNAGTDTAVNFIGTTDNKSLMFRVNNTNAGWLGNSNTSLGYQSLSLTAPGQENTAVGVGTLNTTTPSFDNVAVGYMALNKSAGSANAAIGAYALTANTTGNWNSAVGYLSLLANTTGNTNNAFGSSALWANTTGSSNTAIGGEALFNNTTGSNNTVVGLNAFHANQTGSNNVVVGYRAGSVTTNGSGNILIGSSAATANYVNASSPTANNEMNIGNTLFGTLVDSAVGMGSIGINTRTPVATLDVQGSQAVHISAVSGTYTVLPSDYLMIAASGTGNTITLPPASQNKGRVLIIKTRGSTGSAVDINTSGSDALDGRVELSSLFGSSVTINNGTQVTLISDGVSTWYGN